MDAEYINKNGEFPTEGDSALLDFLEEAGYDIAAPNLEGRTIEELLPQFVPKYYCKN